VQQQPFLIFKLTPKKQSDQPKKQLEKVEQDDEKRNWLVTSLIPTLPDFFL
jgi:hypothetical protein